MIDTCTHTFAHTYILNTPARTPTNCTGPRINENDPELVQLLRDEDDSAALAGEDHITINGLTYPLESDPLMHAK